MSCFDWVVFEMACPLCAERVTGFQTKELACDLRAVLPHMTPNFYSWCPNEKCQAKIEFIDGVMVHPCYDTGAELLPYPPDGRKKLGPPPTLTERGEHDQC